MINSYHLTTHAPALLDTVFAISPDLSNKGEENVVITSGNNGQIRIKL